MIGKAKVYDVPNIYKTCPYIAFSKVVIFVNKESKVVFGEIASRLVTTNAFPTFNLVFEMFILLHISLIKGQPHEVVVYFGKDHASSKDWSTNSRFG